MNKSLWSCWTAAAALPVLAGGHSNDRVHSGTTQHRDTYADQVHHDLRVVPDPGREPGQAKTFVTPGERESLALPDRNRCITYTTGHGTRNDRRPVTPKPGPAT